MAQSQRPEKILTAMHALSKGTNRALRYEDIVVKAFELFPQEFALRGYPQFPDSSDIHKPLYGPLKRGGYVRSNNKMFALTDKGIARAAELKGESKGRGDRLDRVDEGELKRIIESEAFHIFATGDKESLLDTDFYSYLGTTVRTPKNDFLGRLKVVQDAVEAGASIGRDPRHVMARDMHEFLVRRFAPIIEHMRGGHD